MDKINSYKPDDMLMETSSSVNDDANSPYGGSAGATVKVGRIDYMNVAPVYYGFDKGLGSETKWLTFINRTPAELNRLLAAGDVDVSAISAFAYAENQDDWLLLPDLSIGCYGRVMSVILVSRVPFEHLGGRKVCLTKESASAANLLRLLCSTRKMKPEFHTASVRRLSDLGEDVDAALVIGDAALIETWENRFEFIFDLGRLWADFYNLPFVFGLWAVRKEVAEQYPEKTGYVVDLFRKSKESGLQNLETISAESSSRYGLGMDLCREYYDLLDYNLPPDQIKGLTAFYDGLFQQHVIKRPVALNFYKRA